MLLSTVKTESFQDACQRLSWDSRRWGIEGYHRTIKSGCHIEDRRLDDTDSLEACLAIDLVVAWRVYWLTMVGRERPDTPCDQILSEAAWRVLNAWATGNIADTALPVGRQVPVPDRRRTGSARWLAGQRKTRQSIQARPVCGEGWCACQQWSKAIFWLCKSMISGLAPDPQS